MVKTVAILIFYFLALSMAFAALRVVTSRNLVHSVLFALWVLLGTTGIFYLLNAKFLSMVQFLIYCGAVTILLLFVVMLTRTVYYIPPPGRHVPSAALAILFFLGVILIFVASVRWPVKTLGVIPNVNTALAFRLFWEYILPFEVASIILLVGIVGAIVLVGRD